MGLLIAGSVSVGCYTGSSDHDDFVSRASPSLIAEVRRLAGERGIVALPSAPEVRPALVELGRALAFDKELSGNRDISCMTCHQPELGTGDGRSLSIGQGAHGLGMQRVHPDGKFIARNAPPLFNLHAMDRLFWDGRVEELANGSVRTPAGGQLSAAMQRVFEFGAVSALGMFPVMSREEMRANTGNELAAVSDDDFVGLWSAIMDRLGDIPEYVTMFEAAYPGTDFDEMTFAHASNAIGGFIVTEFESNDSAWDRFLDGDSSALKTKELRGAKNFLSARCSICHNGSAFTDQSFHNVALAQLGPGTANGDDEGRFAHSGVASERFAFRTTPLRNVEVTGPYGHAGQFDDLFDFLDHYSESEVKLHEYDAGQLEPALQGTVLHNFEDIMRTRDPLLDGVVFRKKIFMDLESFMLALTDEAVFDLDSVRPSSVPSGLSID